MAFVSEGEQPLLLLGEDDGSPYVAGRNTAGEVTWDFPGGKEPQ